MSNKLEELSAQRELIQKHLNWLDAQIRDAENAVDAYDEPDRVEHSHKIPAQVHKHASCSLEKSDKPTSTESTHHEVEEQMMEYSGSFDIQRVKVGCLIFFAAISLLFLFLLFGLPYLVD